MMSKINIDKMNNIDAIRAARQNSVRTAGDQSSSGAAGAKIQAGQDKMQFSERAGEIGRLVDQLKDLPDMREAKVNSLREQIAAGAYRPSSDDIAAAILNEEF